MRAVAAIVLAAVAASLFAFSTTLQTLEARIAPAESGLRFALLRRLVRRRTWLVGSAAAVAGWPLQAAALALGSVALVQPALGFALVLLLAFGVRILGEHVGPREYAGVAAIVLAVGLLGWAAPASTGKFTDAGTAAVLAWLGVAVAAPFGLRVARLGNGLLTSVAAGIGWAWVGLGTALLDDALAGRRWLGAVLWAVGVGAASAGALLAEMSALQLWPATRAIPVAFVFEMVAPAAAAPALTVHGAGPFGGVPFAIALVVAAAGAALLGGSRSVAHAVQPVEGP